MIQRLLKTLTIILLKKSEYVKKQRRPDSGLQYECLRREFKKIL